MDMVSHIQATLREIEVECQCKVIYACESGSRAWGFDSPDSDWDVRFIYVNPPEWYLSIIDHRDVIERMLPNDLDVSGWELRKALRLMRKSNPPFFEWLGSPLVYMDRKSITDELRQVAQSSYSPERCYHHYRSMAIGNSQTLFNEDEVPLKKYLYVLRPVLACKWIAANLGPAPMEFEAMVNQLIPEGKLRADIEELLKLKRQVGETGRGPKIASIQAFIEAEFEVMNRVETVSSSLPSEEPIDEFFRKTIQSYNRY